MRSAFYSVTLVSLRAADGRPWWQLIFDRADMAGTVGATRRPYQHNVSQSWFAFGNRGKTGSCRVGPEVFDHSTKDRIQQRIRVHDVQI